MAKTKFELFKQYLHKGDFDGVKDNLDPQFLEQFIDRLNNWRPIHIACFNGYTEIVKLLIDNRCNIESVTVDKWKPIHIACSNDYVDIARLLIEQNCIIETKDKDGQTPLEIAKNSGFSEIEKIIEEAQVMKQIHESIINDDENTFAQFYKPAILMNMNIASRQSCLQIAVEHEARRIIKFILERPIAAQEILHLKSTMGNDPDSESCQLWQEVLFYKCIREHHEEGFQLVCRPNIINCQSKMIPISFLETAAEYGSYVFVHEILKKSIYDEQTWKKAKAIASNRNHHQIWDSISDRESLLKFREEANLSILHTAVCDNDPDMVEYILNQNLCDLSQNNETLGTGLALSILLCHEKCVSVMKQNNIDSNTQNKYLQSPLNEAISNGMIERCRYLIDCAKNINEMGYMEQTALHCAVIRGCEELCDQLIDKGADCIQYMEFLPHYFETGTAVLKTPLPLSKRENSFTLCAKINKTIFECLLDKLDSNKANSSDFEGNTLLHLSAKLLDIELCNTLIQSGANVDKINEHGDTPLSLMLSNLDEEEFNQNVDKIVTIVNLFVQYGCDINKRLHGNEKIFKIAAKFNCERLLLAFIPPERNQLFEIDENVIRFALVNRFYSFCEKLLDSLTEDHLVQFITEEIINMAIPLNHTNILRFLVVNANSDVRQSVMERVLHHLAKLEDERNFEFFLEFEIMRPALFENGETLLTTLFKESKFSFCKKVLQSKKNRAKYINLKNGKNQIPLQIAIMTESIDMLHQLISETDQFDNVDNNGHTALMQLFEKISNKNDKNVHLSFINAIREIVFKGGDINHKTSGGIPIIELCSDPQIRNEIETLFTNTQNLKNAEKKDKKDVREDVKDQLIYICKICMDREIDSVYDCGHTLCLICAENLVVCPFCNFQPAIPKRIYLD